MKEIKKMVNIKRNNNLFKNGHVPWNKGIPWSEETKRKISLNYVGNKGTKFT